MRPDTFSVNTFHALLNKFPEYLGINIFIETGTWKGYQTHIATQVFDTVYGIELNSYNVSATKQAAPKAVVIHGDTRDELPHLFKKYKDTPLFIFLDAHYCHSGEQEKVDFPLWSELALVRQRNLTEIVVIDDTHVFGVKCDAHKKDLSVREWEDVTKESLLDFFGDQVADSLETCRAFVIFLKEV
tara:strand:- start:188 stop:745 length:558 start_codon:yes stop_codon:yes gene_type:complete